MASQTPLLTVSDFLFAHALAEKTFLLAVSGGVDSMVLLDVFLRLVPKEKILVAHFDHKVRRRSREDLAFVRQACEKKDIRFIHAERKGRGKSEASLRSERLRFLKEVRRAHGADWIVTAHHAQDQLETFLMRVLRGTGSEGLAAMARIRGRFLKPLLTIPKEEICRWADMQKISFREDETNATESYFRNRVRHRLIPPLFELSEEFGGPVPFLRRFSALTEECGKNAAASRKRARRQFKKLCASTPFWVVLDQKSLLKLRESDGPELVREIYRHLQRELPSRAQLSKICQTLSALRARLSASSDVRIEVSCGKIFFQTKEQGERLKAWNLSWDFEIRRSRWRERLAAGEFEWRFFQPGDRYRGKKLKELYLERRIPSPERKLLPVLARRNQRDVLWAFPWPNPAIQVGNIPFPLSFL